MKAFLLSGVLAAGLAVGLLAPATVEAGDRYSRGGHGYGYSKGHRYYSPAPYYRGGYGYGKGYYRPYAGYGGYYGHRHFSGCGHGGYGYGGYGYGGYGPAYGYGYAPGYVVPPPFCFRPGVSIHLGLCRASPATAAVGT
jgi:hypothetical protein